MVSSPFPPLYRTTAIESLNIERTARISSLDFALSGAIATTSAAHQRPATGNTITVTGTAEAAEVAEIEAAGTLLMSASADGTEIGGLFRVQSGTLAGGLVLESIDVIGRALSNSDGQAVTAIGANTTGPMQLAKYTQITPPTGATFASVSVRVERSVIDNVFANISSTSDALRTEASRDAIQLSRAIAFSEELTTLRPFLGGKQYFGDGDRFSFLAEDLPVFLHGLGSPDKRVAVNVTWFSGEVLA